MFEIVRRTLGACPELIAELQRRGMFLPEESAELRESLGDKKVMQAAPLGRVQFATLLTNGDTQLAFSVVMRGIVTREELMWINRLLKFKPPTEAREELIRTVERKIEGREHGHRPRHPAVTGARKRAR
jgi:hypothetical protein